MHQGQSGFDTKRNTWNRKKGIYIFICKQQRRRGLATGAWIGQKNKNRKVRPDNPHKHALMLAFKAFSVYYIKYIIFQSPSQDRYPRTTSYWTQAIRISGREWCLEQPATFCVLHSITLHAVLAALFSRVWYVIFFSLQEETELSVCK